jgi:transposase
LYAVSSVWNREKGRAQKVTDKYLGRITEEGFIPSKKGTLKMETPITVKESGASGVLTMLGEDILVELRKTFPRHGELIFTISILRLIEHSPFKRLENQYRNSFLSETFKGLKMSTGSLSVFLRDFGGDREKIVEFMKRFVTGSEHILFDGTNILSKSKKMDMNRVGYNKNRDFAPRLNLLYAFAHEAEQPVYYRITAGNVSDISAFKLTIAETGLENVTVVADKGFASEANFRMPEKSGVMYVTPLKRNSALIDTDRLETGGKADLDGYFLFNERPIRHYSAGSVAIFLDGELKAREEKKYLGNIEKGKDGYTMENFIKNQHKFGTIALKTNSLKSPQDVYCIYVAKVYCLNSLSRIFWHT